MSGNLVIEMGLMNRHWRTVEIQQGACNSCSPYQSVICYCSRLVEVRFPIYLSHSSFRFPCVCSVFIKVLTRIEEVQIKKEAPDDPPSRTPSIQARAQQVLASNQISFDPKVHVFNVKGTSGVTHVVTIFPKESCSCP